MGWKARIKTLAGLLLNAVSGLAVLCVTYVVTLPLAQRFANHVNMNACLTCMATGTTVKSELLLSCLNMLPRRQHLGALPADSSKPFDCSVEANLKGTGIQARESCWQAGCDNTHLSITAMQSPASPATPASSICAVCVL